MNTALDISKNIIGTLECFDDENTVSLGGINTFHASNTAVSSTVEHVEQNALGEKTYEEGLADGREHALNENTAQRSAIFEVAQDIDRAVLALRSDIEASHERALSTILQSVLSTIADQHQITAVKNFISQLTAPALQGCVTLHVDVPVSTSDDIGRADECVGDIVEKIIKEITAGQNAECPQFKLQTSKKPIGKISKMLRATWQGGGAEMDIHTVTAQCLALLENQEGTQNGQD